MQKIKFNFEKFHKTINNARNRMVYMAIRDTRDYVPHDTGALQKTMRIYNKPNGTLIQWSKPNGKDYARYQWVGISRYSGRPLKHQRHINPKACARWFLAAKQDNFLRWLDEFKRQLRRESWS